MAGPDQRSLDRFTKADLTYLAKVARNDLAGFVERNPKHRTLPDRRLCILLCQGAALHYVDGRNGVKDFDVWSFFADDGSPTYPYRLTRHRPFERATFQDSTRWIDLLGRTLAVSDSDDPIEAVQTYLASGRNKTPRELRQKAAVVLEPANRRGEVIWPTRSVQHAKGSTRR